MLSTASPDNVVPSIDTQTSSHVSNCPASGGISASDCVAA
jgi:hypothetical protein